MVFSVLSFRDAGLTNWFGPRVRPEFQSEPGWKRYDSSGGALNAILMGDKFDAKDVNQRVPAIPQSELQEGLSGAVAAGDFKRLSVRGGAASVMGRVGGMALQLGTTLVLARLLSPSDYGLQTMVLTLINLCSLFQDAGLSTATVQRETLTNQEVSHDFLDQYCRGSCPDRRGRRGGAFPGGVLQRPSPALADSRLRHRVFLQ